MNYYYFIFESKNNSLNSKINSEQIDIIGKKGHYYNFILKKNIIISVIHKYRNFTNNNLSINLRIIPIYRL